MTQQLQTTYGGLEPLQERNAMVSRSGSQPIFFFDGDFRTWGQVQQRSQLNAALHAIIRR